MSKGVGKTVQILQPDLDVSDTWSHHTIRLTSDVMALSMHFDPDNRKVILLAGLRAGRIMRYLLQVKGGRRRKAASILPPSEGEQCSFVSAGAVYHLEFLSSTEFLALYTNGDVRGCSLMQMMRLDAMRFHDAPLCIYEGHQNKFRADLVGVRWLTHREYL